MENKNETKYIEQFRYLLRYFVVHLEYCYNESINKETDWWTDAEKEYKKCIVKKTGQGYNGDEIQKQINKWCNYPVGKVCISVSARGGYKTKASYLHWYGTGLNIIAEWKDDKIEKLYFRDVDEESSENILASSISRNELFNSGLQSDSLKDLYKTYVGAKQNCLSKKIKKLSKLLEKNYNLILTGAPGTGKTYMTESIAKDIMGLNENDIVPEEQYCFVQFHPSYDYTDFVEGLRPIKSNGQVVFERTDGIFKKFCADAAKDPENKKYVFVIDEINRGEISKIFGELFFSIDPGYREGTRKMKTQYHNLIANDEKLAKDYPFEDGFFVPKNVFIIGTMNDIDRSVESMDFAFRRRFSFAEVTASESESMIYAKSWDADLTNEAISRMQRLNAAIIDPKVGNLTPQFQIGGAYFLKIEKYYTASDTSHAAERLWDYHLKGTLYEYFRGEPDAEIKMELLKAAYDGAK